ncbi:hypothetical protein EDC56_3665 [Sinobacterium caligoides]|uniref:Lipoprotein n=1 Tax=Sinobacterium caligoides TaxID=933926 RepID=A0A3N2DDZ1_9GAMM|nr:hypothetical protein [Sinobacterium caligoides]ROR97996.1 hypothetical protein EDC56_3665 [Sinobacterium caligoides]
MSLLKVAFLSLFIFLVACASNKDNLTKRQDASFQNGAVNTGIKSYSGSGGIKCCYDVYSEIKDATGEKPILVLTRQPEPGTRIQRVSITAGSADELINYLEYQFNLPKGETDQKSISLGGGKWRVGSNMHEGERLVFILNLNYNFAFNNGDLPELINVLKAYREKFVKLDI